MQHDPIEMREGWSEKFFENLLIFIKGRYSPCIATVQALVIGQNHRASLDEKLASAWLLNSAVSCLPFLYVYLFINYYFFLKLKRQFEWYLSMRITIKRGEY